LVITTGSDFSTPELNKSLGNHEPVCVNEYIDEVVSNIYWSGFHDTAKENELTKNKPSQNNKHGNDINLESKHQALSCLQVIIG